MTVVFMHGHLEVSVMNMGFSVLWPQKPSPFHPYPTMQVSFLEKKVTELENDNLTNGDLKSKLKQENTQLVHRSGWGRAVVFALRVAGLTLCPLELNFDCWSKGFPRCTASRMV